jgi:hypothetical protein
MILIILIFFLAGTYLFLVSLGYFHKEFQRELDSRRRTAIRIFSIGLFFVAFLNAFYAFNAMANVKQINQQKAEEKAAKEAHEKALEDQKQSQEKP